MSPILIVSAGLLMAAAKPDPQGTPMPFSLDAPTATPRPVASPGASPNPNAALAIVPGEVNRRAEIRLLTQGHDMAARFTMTMTADGDVDRHVEVTLLRRGADDAYVYVHQPEPMRGTVLTREGSRFRLYHPDTDLTELLPTPDGNDPFFGSELALSDVIGPAGPAVCTSFPEEVVGGRACLVIECRPRKYVSWFRSVTWVDEESFFPVRRIWYDDGGTALRRFDVEKLQHVGRYWWPMHWTVKDPQSGHTTTVDFAEVLFDTHIPAGVFGDERYFRRPPEKWVKP